MDNGHAKQKIIIQIVCVMISIGLWFYVTNIENPIGTTEITRIPVELINTDKLQDSKLAVSPNQDLYVSLKIEGTNRDIKSVSRDDFKVRVDLSQYALKKGAFKVPVEIVDYPNKLNIKNSGVLTVTVNLEDYKEKELPVTSGIDISTEEEHYALEPQFTPEKVTVSGPVSIVDKVVSIEAQGTEKNLADTTEKTYPLVAKDEDGNIVSGVTLSENTAKAVIKINNGKTVPIKVSTVGQLKDGLKLKSVNLSSDSTNIIGPKDIVSEITEITTNPIDLSALTDSTTINLNLKLVDGVTSDIDHNTITAQIVLEKITTKKFDVAYDYTGIKDGLRAVGKLDKVSVTLSGYPSELDKVTADNIKAIIDISNLGQEGTHTEQPKVTLNGVEDSVKVDSSDSVTFDIIKE